MVAALLLFALTTSLVSAQPEGIGAIGWNGEHWLIGTFEGDVVKYDGKEFTRIETLDERILDIESTEDFWLINGWHTLAKYDGKALTKIGEYAVEKIACNTNYCMIYAKLMGEELSEEEAIAKKKEFMQMSEEEREKIKEERLSRDRLFKYDGKALTDLSENVEFPIKEMHWNGKEWMIVGSNYAYIYDGNLLRPVSRYEGSEGDQLRSNVITSGWDGREWLFLGQMPSPDADKTLPTISTSTSGVVRYFPESIIEEPVEPKILRPGRITWTGNYWRICAYEKKLKKLPGSDARTVKYDESEFSILDEQDCGLIENLPSGINLPIEVIKEKFSRVIEAKCNEEYCLINGIDKNGYAVLFIYGKEGFEDITPGDIYPEGAIYDIGAIDWNGEYWLIAATERIGSGKEMETIIGFYEYDGEETTDLTIPKYVISRIDSLGWNGEHWLIGVTNLEQRPHLYKFDGSEITPIELPTEELPNEIYLAGAIGWNGEYWLIAVTGGLNPAFYKYDEEDFEQITPPQDTFIIPKPNRVLFPTKLACNEEYCLIFLDNNDIIKFDGSRFEKVNISFESSKVLYALRNVKWNGEYWLISYTITNEGGSLAKYDGENFIELTEMPTNCFEGGMEWNGEHWLIGTFRITCNRWALLEYDGASFPDLTDKFAFRGLKAYPILVEESRGKPWTPVIIILSAFTALLAIRFKKEWTINKLNLWTILFILSLVILVLLVRVISPIISIHNPFYEFLRSVFIGSIIFIMILSFWLTAYSMLRKVISR